MADLTRRDTLPGQFRITRLQLVNWGTFGGYKDISIDERGALFTGPSGSGKSCLMDAHSLALLPTYDQRFNASSDLTAQGAKQATRNVAAYVRGAWSETNDENEQSHVRYLRGGKATWSAVAATYADGRGSVTTAVVVKWFRDTDNDDTDLKTMYQIHDAEFSLDALDGWAQRGFDLKWFKNSYPGTHRGTQTEYLRDLRSKVGLGTSKTALSLLGKAKAMKNVGDLNTFIRASMLDEPSTFASAEGMVDTFMPLNEAYKTASRAHAQAKELRELPRHWDTYRSSARTGSHIDTLLGTPIEHYLRGRHLDVIQSELDTIDESVGLLDERLAQQREAEDSAKQEFLSWERQVDKQSGELNALEAQRQTADTEARRRREAYQHYSAHVGRLPQQVPTDAESFETLLAELPQLRQQAQDELTDIEPRRYSAFESAAEANKQHRDKSEELGALQSAKTLIPQEQIRRRERIAEATAVPVADLPYAAELIDVAADEERWRPAAEKLLRGYGLRLLVPQRHKDPVRAFIDTNNMHGIVEYSVVDDERATDYEADPETLAGKLTVDTEHACGGWLAGQLARRFDHVCVESADELDEHRTAVTPHGTVKSPDGRYRKDDRQALTSRSSYILGVHTANKRDALKSEVDELAEAAESARAAADELNQRYEQLQAVISASEQLRHYTEWAELDHWEPSRTVGELTERIDKLKSEDVDLRELERNRDKAEHKYQRASDACAETRQRFKSESERQTRLSDMYAAEEDKPHTVDDLDRAELDDAYASVEITVSAERFNDVRSALRKELEQRRKAANSDYRSAQEAVQTIIDRFIELWPDTAPDTSGEIDRCGEDFVTLQHEIEQRSLPDAMTKFQQLISQDMVPSISILQHDIDTADREIKKRVEMVNKGLSRVEFNPGTHLQIAFKANKPQHAREFREHVDAILQQAGQIRRDDPDAALRQFWRVSELMAKFTGTDTESRQWRTNVLDVRTGYTFYGREVDGDGETAHTYHNTSSNSGGEQEKLGAFCLAAALSYNLADADSDGRPRFAPLMLDEAFSKSDESFAYQALAAFEEFGFQLLIAAPIRMAGIVEPVIGQAVLVDKRVTESGAQSGVRSATFGEIATRPDKAEGRERASA